MKRYVLFTFLISVVVVSVSGQNYYELKQAADFFRMHKMKSDLHSAFMEETIEGSAYLNDEFVDGEVFTTSKIRYEGMLLRYNIYNDEMEFKAENDQILAIASPEGIEKIEYGDIKMVYSPYSDAKNSKNGFFIALREGKASLYKKPEIVYQEAKEAAAYSDPKPAMFVRKPDKYYIRTGNDAARLSNKKKDLPDLFPDHSSEIASFIKSNSINPNKEEDLKKLVDYYNSL
jgi:hypothetical protein